MNPVMKSAFYSFLPSGGAVRVAGQQLYNLRNRFAWRAYLPEGGFSLFPESGVPVRHYGFPAGGRLRGAAKLAAPLLLWKKVMAYINLSRQIAKDVSDDGNQALLAHTSLIVASPPLIYLCEKPTVYYCHEYPRYIYEKGIYKTGSPLTELLIAPVLAFEKRIDMKAAKAASILVTNSTFMGQKLRKTYSREPVVVSPGIRADFFRPSRQHSRGNFVLTVGALSHFKRHHLVVEALAHIPKQKRPPMVAVADRGDGKYTEFLQKTASTLDVDLSIERQVSDTRLLHLYRSAAVVACPQKNEPYGLVALEAMACATAVVAVDEGGFRENIVDGGNGLLVSPDSVSLAGAIQSLLSDPARIRALGLAGRDYVLKNRTSMIESESIAVLMEKAAVGHA